MNKHVSENRKLLLGRCFSGKTYHVMKEPKNNTHRDFFKLTRSFDQNEDFDTTNEVLDFDENKGSIGDFDDMLDSNRRAIFCKKKT